MKTATNSANRLVVSGIGEWTIYRGNHIIGLIMRDEHGFVAHTPGWARQNRLDTLALAEAWLLGSGRSNLRLEGPAFPNGGYGS